MKDSVLQTNFCRTGIYWHCGYLSSWRSQKYYRHIARVHICAAPFSWLQLCSPLGIRISSDDKISISGPRLVACENFYCSKQRGEKEGVCQGRNSARSLFSIHYVFLAPSGALGVTISVRLSFQSTFQSFQLHSPLINLSDLSLTLSR